MFPAVHATPMFRPFFGLSGVVAQIMATKGSGDITKGLRLRLRSLCHPEYKVNWRPRVATNCHWKRRNCNLRTDLWSVFRVEPVFDTPEAQFRI